MLQLQTAQDLITLERDIQKYLPQAVQIYGYILSINRGKLFEYEIAVDSFPDFSIVMYQSKRKKETNEYPYKCSFFTKDPNKVRPLLMDTNMVEWKRIINFEGINWSFMDLIQKAACCRNATLELDGELSYLMMLENPSDMPPQRTDFASRISNLHLSHAELVNRNWKFGGDDTGFRFVENAILNFPNCCLLDKAGNPVSWILTYPYCAMGLLYTVPEHRRKKYAEMLVTTLAKKMQDLGYPVYCTIEKTNHSSYTLFKKLGFKEVPGFTPMWFISKPDTFST
ncbi:glycine N-acyltransferase-like protein 3 [Heterodontus francisci]|uniref:glycine N-acyltransferase-like protein 3 n=1 Tax=Heterodontus francisci TaxID=7792 RepID=UPI00355BDE10